MAWGKRCATVVGSVAFGVAALAIPASAQEPGPQWPICDYTPETREAAGSPIDQRWDADETLRELFIEPTDVEMVDGDVHYRDYLGPHPADPPESKGRLYFRDTEEGREIGVHGLMGAIAYTYRAAGAHTALDLPITDECNAEGGGKYNHFGPEADNAEQSIYWRADLGTFLVTDEGPAPELEGIHDHWEAAGWEEGIYGWPTTSTRPTADGRGRFTHFLGDDGGGASIYWSPDTGTWGVKGAIRYRWLTLGAESSYLGYPTSDEYEIVEPFNGQRSDFQGGCIAWDRDTGRVVDAPWDQPFCHLT